MQKLKFKKGDKIICGKYGAGEITRVGSEKIDNKKIEVIELTFINNEMKIMIPVNEIENSEIREPVSKPTMSKILKFLKGPVPKSVIKEIKNKYEESLENIDNSNPKNLAEIIVYLTNKNSLKPLSISDKRFLNHVISMLASEVAIIYEITQKEAEEKIKNILSLK
ncbi:MAG TPA: CarD family transcriptional regulator [bacterium]|nr:CarD family transcriptional regulator [bacterium]HOL46742.1 CarD family transcriptional regulator [bacterium]HPQ18178.1 CarD family transcriptional regulator [bacterium]